MLAFWLLPVVAASRKGQIGSTIYHSCPATYAAASTKLGEAGLALGYFPSS